MEVLRCRVNGEPTTTTYKIIAQTCRRGEPRREIREMVVVSVDSGWL